MNDWFINAILKVHSVSVIKYNVRFNFIFFNNRSIWLLCLQKDNQAYFYMDNTHIYIIQ